MIKTDLTPFDIAIWILNNQNADYTLNFSKYIISEPGLQYNQEREILQVNRSEFELYWLNKQLNSLQHNQELTWNSNIKISDKFYHVPMIDFEVGINQDLIKSASSKLIIELNLQELWFFQSGRSCHAYGFPLLNKEAWYHYLGVLLTLPRDYPNIDTRWIGHSLKRGYSALRWSHNTTRYKHLPTFYHHEKYIR
jgi:hypothetical protein